MLITEDNIPKCANESKCGNKGFIYLDGKFWCGECMNRHIKRVAEAREKLMLEE